MSAGNPPKMQSALLLRQVAAFATEQRRGQTSASQGVLPGPGPADAFASRTWLDDENISAVYGRLLQQTARTSLDPVLLLDPSVAFWLALSKRGADGVQEAVGGLELGAREVVLCPINDCRHGLRGDSGMHWTLLVCVARRSSTGRQEFEFLHYNSDESLGQRSFRQAQRVAEQLGGGTAKVRSRPCAQQANCFDCGIYVLLFSEVILNAMPCGGLDTNEIARACRSVWEERLLSVTPRQAAEYRVCQRKALLARTC